MARASAARECRTVRSHYANFLIRVHTSSYPSSLLARVVVAGAATSEEEEAADGIDVPRAVAVATDVPLVIGLPVDW